MKKILIPFVLFTIFTINLNAQKQITDFEDAEIYFKGLFYEPSQLDDYGGVLIDMGSASAGRYAFRITDVKITMEERAEEPGCADVCPPRVLIHFECKGSACVMDPVSNIEPSPNGVIEFVDIKKGKKAYEFLIALQKFMTKC